MTQERTIVIIKPDAVRAHRIGAIIADFELAGLEVVRMQMLTLDPGLVRELYVEHVGAAHFDRNVSFVASGPVVVLELAGEGAVGLARSRLGPTDPVRAKVDYPKSLRARFGTFLPENAVHASSSLEAAGRESTLFFGWVPEGRGV